MNQARSTPSILRTDVRSSHHNHCAPGEIELLLPLLIHNSLAPAAECQKVELSCSLGLVIPHQTALGKTVHALMRRRVGAAAARESPRHPACSRRETS